MVAKSAAFEKAVTDSRNLKAKPTNDELLEVSLILSSPPVFLFYHMRIGFRFGFEFGVSQISEGKHGRDFADLWSSGVIAVRTFQTRNSGSAIQP